MASSPASTISHQQLLEVTKKAAQAGAAVITQALTRPSVIKNKGELDLVTETDLASEKAVLEVIRSHFPNHAILGEEGGVTGDPGSLYLWAVDPLDGTTNFAHRYPSFACSVGVMEKDEPVAGCVIEFAGGQGSWVTRTYCARKGGGATMNDQPIFASKIDKINKALLVTGFGYDHGAQWSTNHELFKELTDVSQGVRRLGSASIDLVHIAAGVVEAYWEYDLKPWDVAGGVVILKEAGGTVTTMDGSRYSPFHRSLLASNGPMHPTLLGYMKGKTEKLAKDGAFYSFPSHIPDGYDAGDALTERHEALELYRT
jgi:myo-inositol-1(or 4)-monophosphatase